MLEENKKQSQIAIRKAHSLLEKIEKMVDKDEYCIKVVQQILAVCGLLKSASTKVLESHLNTCFKSAMQSKNKKLQKEMIEEILQVHKLLQK